MDHIAIPRGSTEHDVVIFAFDEPIITTPGAKQNPQKIDERSLIAIQETRSPLSPLLVVVYHPPY